MDRIILDNIYKNFTFDISSFLKKYLGNKNKKNKWMLEQVDLTIKAGDSIGILGLNSVGKTTLLKIMANILVPSQGQCIRNGKIVYFSPVGLLYSKLSLKDNLTLYGTLQGYTKKAILHLLYNEDLFASWILPFLDMPIFKCSSGVFIKATFLLSLFSDYDVLLVDEGPLFTDICFQTKVFPLLKHHQAQGRSIVLASHNFAFIEALCDSAYVLEDGRLSANDSVAIIKEYYTNKYQSVFIQ